MALLIDEANLDTLLRAVEGSMCRLIAVRKFFYLGKLRATIVIVDKTDRGYHGMPSRTRFAWEMNLGRAEKDRALWAALRSAMIPYTAQ